jgi:hypothetical protein
MQVFEQPAIRSPSRDWRGGQALDDGVPFVGALVICASNRRECQLHDIVAIPYLHSRCFTASQPVGRTAQPGYSSLGTSLSPWHIGTGRTEGVADWLDGHFVPLHEVDDQLGVTATRRYRGLPALAPQHPVPEGALTPSHWHPLSGATVVATL